ncbi:MAG: ABC transporter ATP-binding protein [Provencibacterium sp.]|jgi:ATP-binding cassette subfamily B multidrug efflux pump|nr:ABC transporter ATP-binding protein [Provencibacterium sp.]
MKKLYPFFAPFMKWILLGMFLKGAGSVADIALPLILSRMVDEGVVNGDWSLIRTSCWQMAAITLLSLASTLWAHYLATHTSQRIGQRIRDRLYRHLQTLSLEDVERYSTATLTTRVTYDIEQIMNFVSKFMRMLVRTLLLGAGGILMCIAIDPYLTLTLAAMMLVILLSSSFIYRLTHRLYRRVQEGLDLSSNIVRESVSGIKTIKAFDQIAREKERFSEQSAIVRDNEVHAGTISAILSPSITLFSNLGLCALLLVAGVRIHGGHMELGQLIAIVSYLNMVVHSMNGVPRLFINFSRASASAGRINELFDTRPHPPEKRKEGAETSPASPAITFENVSFTYAGSRSPTLKGISFTVERGTTLGIVGETGSGKSTLVHLLAGLYQPQEGRILIDGKDVVNYQPGELRRSLSVAQQQYSIFTASVRKNILLDEEEENVRLQRAVRQAQLQGFIGSLEKGLDTEIHQAGSNLSGGQRQRLNVARVFYSNAGILVFDDVSSALDYKTNLHLQKELRGLQHQKTILMITQRLSAIEKADKILVLDHGRVAGLGTHEELLENCAVYQDIYHSQTEVVSVEKYHA